MPFTLAHPAAVLPLRGRRHFDFTALVIGSMTPDLPYYLPLPDLRWATHSFMGSFLFCLPAGLLLWLLWQALKRPLCHVLPQPHRGALLPLAGRRMPLHRRTIAVLTASVLLGAWTHLLWDAFTHRLSWGPLLLPFLHREVLTVAGKTYQVCDGLQWLCSGLGLLALGLAYRRWLRRAAGNAGREHAAEWGRYAWLSGLALLALVAALPFARANAAGFHGWRAYAFEEWVHAASFFCVLLMLYAALRYAGRRGTGTVRTTPRA